MSKVQTCFLLLEFVWVAYSDFTINNVFKTYQWVSAILSQVPIQSIGTWDSIALSYQYDPGLLVLKFV